MATWEIASSASEELDRRATSITGRRTRQGITESLRLGKNSKVINPTFYRISPYPLNHTVKCLICFSPKQFQGWGPHPSLFRCLITLSVKNFSLISSLNLLQAVSLRNRENPCCSINRSVRPRLPFRRRNVFLGFVAGCLKPKRDLIGAGLLWELAPGENLEKMRKGQSVRNILRISLKLPMRRLFILGIEEEEMMKRTRIKKKPTG